MAAAQTADLPTGAFVLLALIMLRDVATARGLDPGRETARLVALGACGALAAWTKNEGAVCLLVTGGLLAWSLRRSGRLHRLAWWVAGAAPVLLTLLWFKFGIAPDAPLYSAGPGTSGTFVTRVLALDLHATIASLVGRFAIDWGGPAAQGCLILVGVAAVLAASAGANRAARLVLVVAPLCVGYYAAWVLLPHDAVWLVSTTFHRLTFQVWPSLVLAAFSGVEGDVT
jgi:hypothetical protein